MQNEDKLTEIITIFTNSLPLIEPHKDNISDSNLLRHMVLIFPCLPSVIESIFNSYLYKCQTMPRFFETALTTLYSVTQLSSFDLKRSIFNYCKFIVGSLGIVRQFALFCIQKVIYVTLHVRPELFKDDPSLSPFPTLANLLEELMPSQPLFQIAKTMYNEYRLVTSFVKLELLTREKVKNIIYGTEDDKKQQHSFESSQNDSFEKERSSCESRLNSGHTVDGSHKKKRKHKDSSAGSRTLKNSQRHRLTNPPAQNSDENGLAERVQFKSAKDFLDYFCQNGHEFTAMFHSLLLLPKAKIKSDKLFDMYFMSNVNIGEIYRYILDPFVIYLPEWFMQLLTELKPELTEERLPVSETRAYGFASYSYHPERNNFGLYRSSMTLAFLVKYVHHKQIFGIYKNYFIQFSELTSRQSFQAFGRRPHQLRAFACDESARILLH